MNGQLVFLALVLLRIVMPVFVLFSFVFFWDIDGASAETFSIRI